MEPTKPVQYPYGFHDPTVYQPNPYELTPIPPPPPKKSRMPLVITVLLLVTALLLFGTSGLFYLAHTQDVNKGQSTPVTSTPVTSTPVTQQNYTANDILQDMQRAGCSCGTELTNSLSIGDFLGQVGFNGPQATSQDAWSDPTQQFDNVGLWIYTDAATALATFQQLGTYEHSGGNSIPITQPTVQHTHGSCLLIISGNTDGNPWSGYQQLLDQYCT